ncbi:ABC transporter permease [Devosia sp. YIM 151766]|uniref:ABC transporter permease n=1 Tax=Devosia sp. YIM 151766 TaxID=3017325 RepID=UPI00255C3DB4|nr:ABC transporter permease [Devosia sp. YIM 151766]WIY52144.1 ABC transporter permease [Devosia sp. YIM 151766]
MDTLRYFTRTNRWVWSAIAVVLLWLVLALVTGRWSLASLSGITLSASFLALAGLGQMMVVTTGKGNIDLSVATVMTLSAYMGMLIIRGSDEMLFVGLLATLGLGIAVGLVNALLVIAVRIPAIIATLASGYILATATLLANRSLQGATVSPLLRQFASGRLMGIPNMALVAMALAICLAIILRKTAYGQQLSAVGQNRSAAALAGIKVNRVVATAFVVSSVLAAFNGLLLGAYVGGAFLEMGQPYLLQSVAVVVIGGTLIFGGSATAAGTLFASVLLVLVVTLMQIMGLPRGTQDMIQGAVVILVLAMAVQGGAFSRPKAKAKTA